MIHQRKSNYFQATIKIAILLHSIVAMTIKAVHSFLSNLLFHLFIYLSIHFHNLPYSFWGYRLLDPFWSTVKEKVSTPWGGCQFISKPPNNCFNKTLKITIQNQELIISNNIIITEPIHKLKSNQVETGFQWKAPHISPHQCEDWPFSPVGGAVSLSSDAAVTVYLLFSCQTNVN